MFLFVFFPTNLNEERVGGNLPPGFLIFRRDFRHCPWGSNERRLELWLLDGGGRWIPPVRRLRRSSEHVVASLPAFPPLLCHISERTASRSIHGPSPLHRQLAPQGCSPYYPPFGSPRQTLRSPVEFEKKSNEDCFI